MTVSELLELLHGLPINALPKNIVIDSDAGALTRVCIETVVDDGQIIGYIITQEEVGPEQLMLPFDDETVN